LSLSGEKRRPPRHSAWRVVGKLGHAHSFKSPLRAIFSDVHLWIADAQVRNACQATMTPFVQLELLCASVLLPFAFLDLGAEWSSRVMCHDACPGGHGLAYTQVPINECKRWARLSCHRGDDANLEKDCDEVAHTTHSHLQRAQLSLDRLYWHQTGRPGHFEIIAIEEYEAYIWAIESRVFWKDECGQRVLRIGDNAVHWAPNSRAVLAVGNFISGARDQWLCN
jgi:hypothetical protein